MKQDFHFLSAEPANEGTRNLFDLAVMEAVLLALRQRGMLDPVQYRRALVALRNAHSEDQHD